MRISILFGLTIIVLCCPVFAQHDAAPALFDSALAQIGLTAEDVRFDQDEMAVWQGDRWVLDYFRLFHRNPFKLPSHAEVTLEALGDNVTGITELITWATRRIDQPIRRGLIGDPLEKYTIPSDSFPLFSITGKRNLLLDKKYSALRTQIDVFYRLVDDKESYFRTAIEPLDKGKYRKQLWEFFRNEDAENGDAVEELFSFVDAGRLNAGAEELSMALQRVADSAAGVTFPDWVVRIKTGHGDIYVGTAGDDIYEFIQAPLLIVDGGGNDIYRFQGQNEERPVAAIVDIGGNDRYESRDTTKPGIAGALIGFSGLIDLAGDDVYIGNHLAFGAGLFGIGCLVDVAGNDTYKAMTMSEGAGLFGIGILADSSGEDTYYCRQMAQGFGYTQGCGLLVDGSGNDTYTAEDDTLFSPSSQTPDHNNSLAQGVGFGRRADYLDGHSWAGGVGVLCDVSGDDVYSAGLFAQGCAYWFAVGELLDGGGDDQYNGIWYVQGSGAHFAVGYLDDFGGRDTYTATHNMAVGAGHDFTIGYFNERGGNDTYTVPNLSLGGGNANGIGLFHDHSGDDTYVTKENSTTLGRANGYAQGLRGRLACFGVFVDGGGADSYSESWASEGTRWLGPSNTPDNPNPAAVGVGIDRND